MQNQTGTTAKLHTASDTFISTPSLFVLGTGRHHEDTKHQWGPGVRNHFQLHHVMRGRGTYRCKGRQFALNAGDTFLIFPNSRIHYEANEEEPWECMWVGFSGQQADSIVGLTDFTPTEPVYRGQGKESLRPLFQSICDSQGTSPSDMLEMNGRLCALLAFLIRSSERAQTPDNPIDCAIAAADYIRTHFDEPLSIETLATLMSVSQSTLYRNFVKHFGVSPKKFMMACRIERACTLLEETDCSIHEISRSVGFEDPFYFSRAFKEAMGIPPKQYANRAALRKKPSDSSQL